MFCNFMLYYFNYYYYHYLLISRLYTLERTGGRHKQFVAQVDFYGDSVISIYSAWPTLPADASLDASFSTLADGLTPPPRNCTSWGDPCRVLSRSSCSVVVESCLNNFAN